MKYDLTKGTILPSILSFTLPLLIGNILQQAYNLVDTYVIGQAMGANALAAVGSCYTLMTFIISIITGLCMGSSALFSFYFGQKQEQILQKRMSSSFLLIGLFSILLQFFCIYKMDFILQFLHTPASILNDTKEYLQIIFYGILFLFLYNYFAYALRSIGNSIIPLYFLGLSTLTNIICDFIFVMYYNMGISGVAWATLFSQILSAICIVIYCIKQSLFHFSFQIQGLKEILSNSFGACIQQSIMNFGILMIQSLVNTFGATVMAAFAIGVKIDTLAYMPVQEFGNAFSTFLAQNYGARQNERMQEGTKIALKMIIGFSLFISCIVFLFSKQLLMIFSKDASVLSIGIQYLHIEGSFYIFIGLLFFFYGYFRALKKPGISIILTIVSLGTRVFLSYVFAPIYGYSIIWISIVIGWIFADLFGFIFKKRETRRGI
ncbi:MATE family efflux transporter [Floccifex sp.]|uniref:MATE family efflux transporter n=1 Tax=Floccifex sp. TaxID=2815810 RepID=UPI003EFD465A